METKDVLVVCPCCESRIEVDVRTGKVLRWRKPAELDDTGKPVVNESDCNAANERVSGRMAAASDKFDAGLAKERQRERDLDELFRRASDKLNEESGE